MKESTRKLIEEAKALLDDPPAPSVELLESMIVATLCASQAMRYMSETSKPHGNRIIAGKPVPHQVQQAQYRRASLDEDMQAQVLLHDLQLLTCETGEVWAARRSRILRQAETCPVLDSMRRQHKRHLRNH